MSSLADEQLQSGQNEHPVPHPTPAQERELSSLEIVGQTLEDIYLMEPSENPSD